MMLGHNKIFDSFRNPKIWMRTDSVLSWKRRRLFTTIVAVAATFSGCNRSNEKAGPTTEIPQSAIDTKPSSGRQSSDLLLEFTDITEKAKVTSTYFNGEESDNYSIVESIGGGVGTFDFNHDGLPDLFFPGGGQIKEGKPLQGLPGSLWMSNENLSYRDASEPSGLNVAGIYSHGTAIADVDADGFPDLLVTGYGGLQLFINNGDGTFTEQATQRGLDLKSWSTSAAFGDFDNDGLVDLYVTNYVDWSWENHPICRGGGAAGRDVCTPQLFNGIDDVIYWNQGDGNFQRNDQSAGLAAGGKGLGVLAVDIDDDGLLDIYVANDTTANFLYQNLGKRQFREAGLVSGTALDHLGIPNGSMGLATFDLDKDLRPDLFVTNFENETFAVYRNAGGGNFRCVSERTGVTALGMLRVGFGVVSGDFNLTGREDLVVSNGHVMRYPRQDNLRQPALYIANDGSGSLESIQFADESYFSTPKRGRGVITTDLDDDGRLDLVFSHINEPAVLLRNGSASAGNWISLRLVGKNSNRDAIGARAVLHTQNGSHLRHVIGGGSYLSQSSYLLHWGFDQKDTPVAIDVFWPDGEKNRIEKPSPNQPLIFVQPEQTKQF